MPNGRTTCGYCGKWFGIEDKERETISNHICNQKCDNCNGEGFHTNQAKGYEEECMICDGTGEKEVLM